MLLWVQSVPLVDELIIQCLNIFFINEEEDYSPGPVNTTHTPLYKQIKSLLNKLHVGNTYI